MITAEQLESIWPVGWKEDGDFRRVILDGVPVSLHGDGHSCNVLGSAELSRGDSETLPQFLGRVWSAVHLYPLREIARHRHNIKHLPPKPATYLKRRADDPIRVP